MVGLLANTVVVAGCGSKEARVVLMLFSGRVRHTGAEASTPQPICQDGVRSS